jgi:hypothetical protein
MAASLPGQTYFDVEGDDNRSYASKALTVPRSAEKTVIGGPLVLTWRGDPSDTYADWTLVVVTNELETNTYHVHKNVMCFGPRQSKYFAKVMLSQQHGSNSKSRKKRSQTENTVKVELDQRDADNFPFLLDYIYASCNSGTRSNFMSSNGTVATAASTLTSHSLQTIPSMEHIENHDCSSLLQLTEEITTQNAVSIRHLARMFEVDSLIMSVNKFIQRDLNFRTGPGYLSAAYEYNDERLLESAKMLCAENIRQIDTNALMALPLDLFRVLVQALESSFDEHRGEKHSNHRQLSACLSEVVYRYLETHPQARSAETLLELTDSLHMPYMSSEAAIGYTAIIKDLDPAELDGQQHWSGLLALSRRCAKAVVKEYGWSDFSVHAAVDEYLEDKVATQKSQAAEDEGASFKRAKVDSMLFATSFAAALEQAQDDYDDMVVEQERLQDLVHQLHESATVLERCVQKKDGYIRKQQAVIEDAKNQIVRLKEQIGIIRSQQLQQQSAPPQFRSSTPPKFRSSTSPLTPPQFRSPPHTQYRTPPDLQEMSTLTGTLPVRELVSPNQVGSDVHANKNKKRNELRTKSEMRARSLLV